MAFRAFVASLVFALAIGTARADQYAVTAPDVSGLAQVDATGTNPDGSRAVKVSLGYTRFSDDKDKRVERTWAGTGRIDTAGVLEFTYEARVETSGLASFFGKIGLKKAKVETRKVRLVRDGQGFTGTVDGIAQRWQPRSAREKDLVFIAIPGLSTNGWNKVGIPYLDENVDALRARGLQAYRLAIKTEDSVASNAQVIARAVLAEAQKNRKVVLMAHSKGATDTTAALALYPDLLPHVAGVIAIQPVFLGSPIADIVGESKVLTGVVKVAFENIFKGEKEAVIDLSHASRAKFLAAHPYPASKVPTIVVRSTFDRKLGSKSVLYPNQKFIEWKLKKPSDGMVTPEDQTIPGVALTLDYADLDHFEPGLRVESPHKPCDLTNRLANELLARVAK